MIPHLLHEYMDATDNTPLTGGQGNSQDLALDYLQFITGETAFTLPPQFTALDWADPGPAQAINTVAAFYSAMPDRERPAKRRAVPAPQVGDIVLFGTGDSGFLGLYCDIGASGHWYVYTQSPSYHPQLRAVSLEECRPVGWWRPRSERIAVDHLRAHQARQDALTAL